MIKKRRRSSDLARKKHKSCPFKKSGILSIDYKDVEALRAFITERGKILPRRVTGTCQTSQRDLTLAIKRARYMAILPFVDKLY